MRDWNLVGLICTVSDKVSESIIKDEFALTMDSPKLADIEIPL